MPELPEVETVRRGLEPVFTGAAFARVDLRRPDLRFPFPDRFAERLTGSHVLSLGRRAKYLLARLDSGDMLAMHLGMSGRFSILRPDGREDRPGEFTYDTGADPAHDHVVFSMSNGAVVRYNDARRFGYMLLLPEDEMMSHDLFRGLGAEPLGNEMSAQALAAGCARRKTTIKAALLDQRLIAGLGNIYVCEALHRASISPLRRAGVLARRNGQPGERTQPLVDAIRAVLTEAIQAGGSTLRDYRTAEGGLGYFQHAFAVYGREGLPCSREGCSGVIRRVVQSGRSSFYCPACQK
ncbi:MAG: bifunctional DNA-formamidopyrimidine glycosylase/DNA-(apurinic or apyrimidinic site) lyase [Pseudomonadota bacterium]|nr:bifunctional DNA-formamidopyrimidine glycosylase/DNA-(apurinic or apyrimidinic site) lyase [Pseudomonadota bacterium]